MFSISYHLKQSLFDLLQLQFQNLLYFLLVLNLTIFIHMSPILIHTLLIATFIGHLGHYCPVFYLFFHSSISAMFGRPVVALKGYAMPDYMKNITDYDPYVFSHAHTEKVKIMCDRFNLLYESKTIQVFYPALWHFLSSYQHYINNTQLF